MKLNYEVIMSTYVICVLIFKNYPIQGLFYIGGKKTTRNMLHTRVKYSGPLVGWVWLIFFSDKIK